MIRRFVIIAVVLGFAAGLFQLGTSAQQPSGEQRRGRQEIAVMKSILQTTLDFASREVEKNRAEKSTGRAFGERGFSQITGLYLRGQGAVFTIPISGMGRIGDDHFDFSFRIPEIPDMPELVTGEAGQISVTVPTPMPMISGDLSSEDLDAAQAALEKAQKDLEKGQTKSAEAKAKTKERLQRNMDQIKKNQERMKQRQQDREKRQAELAQQIESFKVYLKDALANHGDSLSIVKPQEFVTFVITADGMRGWYGDGGGDEQTQQVVSVKKSDVAEFKSGRITREQFDQRVLDYQY